MLCRKREISATLIQLHLKDMAYHRGQNSTFEFCLYFWHSILKFYNLYLHLQFNIQVSNFSTPIDDLTLFVSQFNIQVYAIQHPSLQFNIQVYAIQHPSLRNSTFNFGKCMFSISNRNPVNDSQCGLRKLLKFSQCRG